MVLILQTLAVTSHKILEDNPFTGYSHFLFYQNESESLLGNMSDLDIMVAHDDLRCAGISSEYDYEDT